MRKSGWRLSRRLDGNVGAGRGEVAEVGGETGEGLDGGHGGLLLAARRRAVQRGRGAAGPGAVVTEPSGRRVVRRGDSSRRLMRVRRWPVGRDVRIEGVGERPRRRSRSVRPSVAAGRQPSHAPFAAAADNIHSGHATRKMCPRRRRGVPRGRERGRWVAAASATCTTRHVQAPHRPASPRPTHWSGRSGEASDLSQRFGGSRRRLCRGSRQRSSSRRRAWAGRSSRSARPGCRVRVPGRIGGLHA